VFVLQGYFHHFENIGKDDLRFLIVFNNSTRESNDDIGISVSLGGTPNEALAATFGVPKADFKPVPKLHQELIITRRR
jgi:oxalate decarboxylase/phosphoglucose isomerase-like protein (cupin superfamily)